MDGAPAGLPSGSAPTAFGIRRPLSSIGPLRVDFLGQAQQDRFEHPFGQFERGGGFLRSWFLRVAGISAAHLIGTL